MANPPSQPPDHSDTPSPADRLQQLLMQLWISSRGTVAERLATLGKAQAQMDRNALDDRVRREAGDAAHKLAGILGTFGLPRGTELALQLELALEERAGVHLTSSEFRAKLDELIEMVNQKSAESPMP